MFSAPRLCACFPDGPNLTPRSVAARRGSWAAQSHVIRMAMVEALGFVICSRIRGGPDAHDTEAADKAAALAEARAAAAANSDDTSTAAAAAAEAAGDDTHTRGLFDALEERLRDSHAFVRMRVLQTYLYLVE